MLAYSAYYFVIETNKIDSFAGIFIFCRYQVQNFQKQAVWKTCSDGY
jgi:hypothetical protein